MLAQIIVGVAYGTFMGPYLGLRIPLYIGWVIVPIGFFFMVSPGIYFQKMGRPQEGKTTMDTTVLVDIGTFSIVRHPMYLGGVMLMSASIMVSQHWLSAVVGISIGDDYRRYMQRVPRLNPLLGVIRLLKR